MDLLPKIEESKEEYIARCKLDFSMIDKYKDKIDIEAQKIYDKGDKEGIWDEFIKMYKNSKTGV